METLYVVPIGTAPDQSSVIVAGRKSTACRDGDIHFETEPYELDRIAAELNNRPRRTLGYMTPAEKLAELTIPS